jgi:hypothetical protein
MKEYILWAKEGIVSEVISFDGKWLNFEYRLGNIGEGLNDFIGTGGISYRQFQKEIADGRIIAF